MGAKRVYPMGPPPSVFREKVRVNQRCASRASLSACPMRHEAILPPVVRGAGDSAAAGANRAKRRGSAAGHSGRAMAAIRPSCGRRGESLAAQETRLAGFGANRANRRKTALDHSGEAIAAIRPRRGHWGESPAAQAIRLAKMQPRIGCDECRAAAGGASPAASAQRAPEGPSEAPSGALRTPPPEAGDLVPGGWT